MFNLKLSNCLTSVHFSICLNWSTVQCGRIWDNSWISVSPTSPRYLTLSMAVLIHKSTNEGVFLLIIIFMLTLKCVVNPGTKGEIQSNFIVAFVSILGSRKCILEWVYRGKFTWIYTKLDVIPISEKYTARKASPSITNHLSEYKRWQRKASAQYKGSKQILTILIQKNQSSPEN